MACHNCGQVSDQPRIEPGMQLVCSYCESTLRSRHNNWESRVVALTITGLILFVIANVLPFLGLEQAGLSQQSNLISGVQALIDRDAFLLAALVFISIFLFPLFELLGLAYVIGFRLADIKAPHIGRILQLLRLSEPWSMLEIFLIGVLVASIKLAGMAALVPGYGLYAFLGLVVVLLACHMYMDHDEIWDWLETNNFYADEQVGPLHGCHTCNAVIGLSVLERDNHCPRCTHPVYPVWPRSVQKTAALLFAATVLFIPANFLPIMSTTHFGQASDDTIFSGVMLLAEHGDVPIALLVFFASIIIPIAKLLVMGYLLWSVKYAKDMQAKELSNLFHVTEFVGRWSMIDVFVVSILVALVQFGLLANVEPGPALLCFAGVVVLTMLAAETFDPKLLWPAQETQHSPPSEGPPNQHPPELESHKLLSL